MYTNKPLTPEYSKRAKKVNSSLYYLVVPYQVKLVTKSNANYS